MRNEKLVELEALVGDWDLTLSGAWFLDSLETQQRGRATFEWLGDAFVIMRSRMEGEPVWDLVFGRNDAREQLYAFYHDNRGVNRLLDMAFDGRTWTMSRQDPDFHQRFIADVERDRILGRWEASEDAGGSWRKDFDLIFERSGDD